MIVGLLMGRKGSEGFPSKNLLDILGKPMMAYPLEAGLNAKYVEEVYVTTDDERIKEITLNYKAQVIDRPAELCTSEALGEDVFVHGLEWIKEHTQKEVEFVVLLMCNAATVTSALIDQGIEVLRKDETIDSAVSVSCYNMWSPTRARKEDENGLLKPFVPFDAYGDDVIVNCDRDSQGDVWFADMGVSIVRPRCLENLEKGLLPQKWMGQNIYPLKQWGGFDADYEWQIPLLEYWLKKEGLAK